MPETHRFKPMKTSRSFLIPLLAVCSSTCFGAVIYQETFNLGVSNNSWYQLDRLGWTGTVGDAESATDVTSDPMANAGNHLGFHGSSPSANINNYLVFQKTNAGTTSQDAFARTTTVSFASGLQGGATSINPLDYSSLTASWNRTGEGFSSEAGYYFTVEISGTWYGSLVSPSLGDVLSHNILTATWHEITSTSSSLNISTTDAGDIFSSGDPITGIGFYIDNLTATTGNRTLRIDNLVIEGTLVPEPSSAVLLSLVAFAGLRRTRR